MRGLVANAVMQTSNTRMVQPDGAQLSMLAQRGGLLSGNRLKSKELRAYNLQNPESCQNITTCQGMGQAQHANHRTGASPRQTAGQITRAGSAVCMSCHSRALQA